MIKKYKLIQTTSIINSITIIILKYPVIFMFYFFFFGVFKYLLEHYKKGVYFSQEFRFISLNIFKLKSTFLDNLCTLLLLISNTFIGRFKLSNRLKLELFFKEILSFSFTGLCTLHVLAKFSLELHWNGALHQRKIHDILIIQRFI